MAQRFAPHRRRVPVGTDLDAALALGRLRMALGGYTARPDDTICVSPAGIFGVVSRVCRWRG
ncbi:MAG: hypothetical protein M3R38_28030 [Actinomycetota bacterium]|nr:hypothetical protein [Actinomycetota bacterium]